jgi:hypothetical protein
MGHPVYEHFKKFFINKLSPTSIMPRIATENHFTFVRSYALNRTTAIEHQIASRIAKTIDPLQNDIIDDPLVRMRINRELTSFHYLIIHYMHEERFRTSKKGIHQIWHHIFADTPVIDTKLIIGNRNSRNAIKVLVRRQPQIILSSKTITNNNLE